MEQRRVCTGVRRDLRRLHLIAQVGLLDRRPLLLAGIALMLVGWISALAALGGVLW